MSDTPFNQLTPAEAERLAMLAEEASEIILAVNKALRHGMDGAHPDHPEQSNRDDIVFEIADVEAMRVMMVIAGDIDGPKAPISEDTLQRIRKKIYHGHHQDEVSELLDQLQAAPSPATADPDSP